MSKNDCEGYHDKEVIKLIYYLVSHIKYSATMFGIR